MAQHMVYCIKLQKEAPGIDEDDIQGEVALEMIESIGGPELRERIYENVSMEAWELWKGFLTMIMNEYRLRQCPLPLSGVLRSKPCAVPYSLLLLATGAFSFTIP